MTSPHPLRPERPGKQGGRRARPAAGATPPPDLVPAIVGIGASAGGLAAFEEFIAGMPSDAGSRLALVLVQHLDPAHKSLLPELLQRHTGIRVFEAEDGMLVRPDCIYVLPPNRSLTLSKGTLKLQDPAVPHGPRLPIDAFFQSLADELHDRAIGVVLSGTGRDGTLGAQALKEAGGCVLAQTPSTAEFDGMPRSVIDAGLADHVLPPAKMAARILAHLGDTRAQPAPALIRPDETPAEKIFRLLLAQTGHDFSQYKKNTIHRRIEHRMAALKIADLSAYAGHLEQNPAEVQLLFGDLLIGVTTFFRDPKGFDALHEQVLRRLFAARPPGSLIRVWVPGCSTGEEAYSIAILLLERLEALNQGFKVQIFATDLDPRAIGKARAGLYAASIRKHVSPERLARFFIHDPAADTYRIRQNVRDLLVFSEQDVTRDPPFSKVDLVSCRNLLIYMAKELQTRLIPTFHYALNPGGLLFLGSSETVGDYSDLFAILDAKSKLYQRKEAIHASYRPTLRPLSPSLSGRKPHPLPSKAPASLSASLRDLTERSLLLHLPVVAALVDERGDIHYLHGRTDAYLEPAPGDAVMNILRMARSGLRGDLTAALSQAVAGKRVVRHAEVRVSNRGQDACVHLTVRPVSARPPPGDLTLYLVVFEDAPAPPPPRIPPADPAQAGDVDSRIAALQQDLASKEAHLQTIRSELETSTEELKSSNEEMQSVNEELQSTNEELETSKEELQSVNEELATLNSELETKVTDLSRANNDLSNLMAGTAIGTIFVDHQLRLQRFTPAVTQIISLIPGDVGRPVGQIVSNLSGYDRLTEDIQTVLDTLVPLEVEVRTKAGPWFLLRIRPYRTQENVIEGAVITFVDITEMKRTQEALSDIEVARRLAAVVRDAFDAITVHDREGRFLAFNPRAEALYGYSEAEALKLNVRDLIPKSLRAGEISRVEKLGRSGDIKPHRTQRIAKGGKIVNVSLTATALLKPDGTPYATSTMAREFRVRKGKS